MEYADPLLSPTLTGVRIGERGTKATVITYADDVTVIVRRKEDIPIIQQAIHT
jgi:hypothetical protein